MPASERLFTILVADDDPEDRLLIKDALAESGLDHHLRVVSDGEELLDYLRECASAGATSCPYPDLLLLDLNMPRKDGREVLRELKADSTWQRIPVVVLTTSTAEEDIRFCYDTGASSYCTKPVSFKALCDLMEVLSSYWFTYVQLPPRA